MNTKDIEDLFRLFQQISMTQEQQRDLHTYSTMRHESEYHVKFASWIKQAYPEVWEAWRALQDLEHSAKTEISTPIWGNR